MVMDGSRKDGALASGNRATLRQAGDLRLSTSVSLMFRETPLEQRMARARAVGFEGVEIQLLTEGDPKAVATAAAQAGVEVVLINVGMGDYNEGGAGLSGTPGREAEFRRAFEQTAAAAALMGARFVHLGPSRPPQDATIDACWAVYERNVAFALNAAAGADFEILIEPMNRVDEPRVLLVDMARAERILRTFEGRLGMLFDIYHAAMNGEDVKACFEAFSPWVRHIQFADAPGRSPPGSGVIDFRTIFSSVAAGAYSGWLGAEYWPPATTEQSFGWLADVRGWLSPPR